MGFLFPVAVAVAYALAVAAAGRATLRLMLGQRAVGEARQRGGPVVGAAWDLTVGQGVVGFAWLACALAGRLRAPLVATFVLAGCVAQAILLARRRRRSLPAEPAAVGAWSQIGPGHRIALLALAAIALLSIFGSVLPTRNEDALRNYLVMARLVAEQGQVTFQASNPPMYGLFPLQVEMHWAALLLVGGDTAVTVFDALGAAATLAAAAGLAAASTPEIRARVMAPVLLASTPAFVTLIGVCKIDDAAAAYGILAFAALAAFGVSTRAALLSGLCLGWALASRYTDVVLVPAWLAMLWARRPADSPAARRLAAAAAAGLAAGWLPMIVKNWALDVHVFAPLLGDAREFWRHAHGWEAGQLNLSWLDTLLLPFVSTFGERKYMLGTVSPLYLGLLPAFVLLRRDPAVRAAAWPGLLGLVALATSVVLQPRSFHTRHHFVALALLAVPIAVAACRLGDHLGRRAWTLWPPVLGLLALWVSMGAWRATEAVRYLTGIVDPARRHAGMPGSAVGRWLSETVPPDARVSLIGFTGYPAFVRSDLLVHSESREELQALWAAGVPAKREAFDARDWGGVVARGCRYAVVKTPSLEPSLASWPLTARGRPAVAYRDPEYSVVEVPR